MSFPLTIFVSLTSCLSPGTLLSAVPSSHQVVFYVIVSPSFARYTSQPFRQLASAIIQAVKLPMIGQLDNDRVLFHFVPRHLVFGSQFPSSRSAALEQIANSVYNRVPLRIERFMPRKVFAYNALPHRAWVEAPSFTLSRPLVPTFKFTMEWPVATIADIDRHTFLHVGYLPSPCGRWLFASCVDERGQGHTNKVWLLSQIEGDDPSPEKKIVETVLDFALEFSRRANLEWRLVFARLGVMSEAELEGIYDSIIYCFQSLTSIFLISMGALHIISHRTKCISVARILCLRRTGLFVHIPPPTPC
jgi:mediator of RNA polymerase II transcription subunit 13